MPQLTNGALLCPVIKNNTDIDILQFSSLIFEPFIFGEYKRKGQREYISIESLKNVIGVYVVKDISSNKLIRAGSSTYNLYDQVALFVQHYKIVSGSTSIAFLRVEPSLIDNVVRKIKTVHRSELIDDTFYKILPVVLAQEPISLNLLHFFPLYNKEPVGPRPTHRVKSNIAHLQKRPGVYVLQMSLKDKNSWYIEYVGKAANLNSRIHAHFIASQANYRPTSNYYHLRETHDFKVGVIEFPRNEEGLISVVENYLIKQWDPPGNRYGRGLTKEEISSFSLNAWKPIDVEFF